jgi:hypothetical protein
MAQTFSFDIVSKIEMHEVLNALNQATKEMSQRFDFKGSKSEITLNQKESEIHVVSDNEMKLRSVLEILQGRLAKRSIPHKALVYGKVEDSFAGTVKQTISIQSGIEIERCKEIVKMIKELKLKVQATIQEAQVRVVGSKKDDLQTVMQMLRDKDLPYHVDFANYR